MPVEQINVWWERFAGFMTATVVSLSIALFRGGSWFRKVEMHIEEEDGRREVHDEQEALRWAGAMEHDKKLDALAKHVQQLIISRGTLEEARDKQITDLRAKVDRLCKENGK